MVGRTTLIIAHRLSTIRNADLIVVLEGKHIAEMGTHAELMARNGLYRRLNEVQSALSRGGENGHAAAQEAVATGSTDGLRCQDLSQREDELSALSQRPLRQSQ